MKETITLTGIVPETAIYEMSISWRDLEKNCTRWNPMRTIPYSSQ